MFLYRAKKRTKQKKGNLSMNEKIKVMIGDENKEAGCMLANALRGRGFFAVTRSCDGLMLLETIRSEEPDIVIVDSIIPGIDAAELIKKNTRNYAKRQITWFKRYQDISVVPDRGGVMKTLSELTREAIDKLSTL